MGKQEPEAHMARVYRCVDIFALEVIGGKWRLPIIWTLSLKGPLRYNELKRHLEGITNIMLTRSLQGLEAFGLVTRTAYDEVPPRVEYALTDRCREVLPALEIINRWGQDLLREHDGAKTLEALRRAGKA